MGIFETDSFAKGVAYYIVVKELSREPQSQFLQACYNVDYEQAFNLINEGQDINEVCKLGYNGLQHMINSLSSVIPTTYNIAGEGLGIGTKSHLIYRKGEKFNNFKKLFILLLNSGIDINYVNPDNGISALSIALETDGFVGEGLVEILVKLGADKNLIEISPIDIYEYQDSMPHYRDLDFSCIDMAIKEYYRYLRYLYRIKKYDLRVFTNSPNDGYVRKKKLIKTIINK